MTVEEAQTIKALIARVVAEIEYRDGGAYRLEWCSLFPHEKRALTALKKIRGRGSKHPLHKAVAVSRLYGVCEIREGAYGFEVFCPGGLTPPSE